MGVVGGAVAGAAAMRAVRERNLRELDAIDTEYPDQELRELAKKLRILIQDAAGQHASYGMLFIFPGMFIAGFGGFQAGEFIGGDTATLICTITGMIISCLCGLWVDQTYTIIPAQKELERCLSSHPHGKEVAATVRKILAR